MMIKCPDCSQQVSDLLETCPHCGRALHSSPPPDDDEPKMLAKLTGHFNSGDTITLHVSKRVFAVGLAALMVLSSLLWYGVAFSLFSSRLERETAVSYDSGYSAGKSAGFSEGKETGYDDGYDDGYSEGKSYGYDTGETAGYTTGYAAAKDEVQADLDAAREEGYETGYSEGKEAGYDEGYDDGKVATSTYYSSDADDDLTVSSSGQVYVSTSGGKIHSRSNCSGMKHYTTYPSLESALAAGYTKCKNCY